MAQKRRKPPDPPFLRTGLLPLSLVVFAALLYAAGWSFGAALASTIPFVAGFLLAPRWANASLAALDRDLVQLSQAGKKGELARRVDRALGLRLFGPPAHRAERRARVAMELGDAATAKKLYEKAFAGYEDRTDAPLGVRLGHAHACHVSGAHAEAIAAYRDVLATHGAMPRVRRNLAWSLLEEGEAARDALALLEHADKEAPDDDARAEVGLLTAWALARLGERKRARELLAANTDVATEVGTQLRAEVEAALSRRRAAARSAPASRQP
jgi:tetratricopeptide (TPR) repeat protein